MKVLITGAGGLLGRTLAEYLTGAGHTPVPLGRLGISDSPGRPAWNSATGEIDAAALQGAFAVVHLAGENIGAKRWSPSQKARIVESRVGTTRRLCEFLSRSSHRPTVFLCGSAVGYYGHRGDDRMTEQSPRGTGFLSDLCQAWEDSTRSLKEAGTRVVSLRTAVVLTPRGAPLSRMLVPFRLGLGGPLGNGQQYTSWIDLEDHVRAMYYLLQHPTAEGPVNLSAPEPVTNAEFTRVLAKVLRRPAIMRVPAVALRTAFGELADELLLASTRVVPERLKEWGFSFLYPDLESSLRHQLSRT